MGGGRDGGQGGATRDRRNTRDRQGTDWQNRPARVHFVPIRGLAVNNAPRVHPLAHQPHPWSVGTDARRGDLLSGDAKLVGERRGRPAGKFRPSEGFHTRNVEATQILGFHNLVWGATCR